MLRKLSVLFCLVFVSQLLNAADKVVLQLKWEHQFQFAGYYAADWQGFYRDAGLDVEIRSAVRPDGSLVTINDEIKSGNAQFAIGSLDILLGREDGMSPVVLAPIFQESALALFSLKSTDISSLEKVSKLRVAASASQATKAEFESLFRSRGFAITDITFVDQPLTIKTLIDDKADVVATYSSPAFFEAKELGVELNRLKPSEFGMRFYGDTLYAEKSFVSSNPDVVERFVTASLKGWRYALENKQVISRLIADKLPRYMVEIKDPYQFNLAFADSIEDYIKYPELPLGHINKARWFNMNERMRTLGIVHTKLDFDTFYFDPSKAKSAPNNRLMIIVILAVFLPLTFYFWSRRFRLLTIFSILLAGTVLEFQLEAVMLRGQMLQNQTKVTQKLNTITAELQGNLQTNLSMLTGFAAYISVSPDLSYQEFSNYAKQQFRKEPMLINFAAAKDLKVNYVFPLEGNEKVVGLDYRKNPKQIDMVMQVMQTGQLMVAGPVELVQGGRAFIGRAPIVLSDGTPWGIISAPLDADLLFQSSEILSLEKDIVLTIRSFDALGNEGPVFFGDQTASESPTRSTSVISVGGGSWHIDAAYINEKGQVSTEIFSLRLYFLFATLFICIFTWLRFKQEMEKNKLQLEIKDDKILLDSVGKVAKIGGWKLDPDFHFSKWSTSCSSLLREDEKFSPSTVSELMQFFSNESYALLKDKIDASISNSEPFDIEVEVAAKNNDLIWLRIMSDAIRHGKDQAITGTLQDVTRKVLSAKLIEHQATFDSLTGLPNRLLYNDRLSKAVELAKRYKLKIAVLFIDLDRFKPINDNHGHQTGDEILIESARRIRKNIRESDTVSRLSGDEFALILHDVVDYRDVKKVAEQIISEIQLPYVIGDISVHTSASIGIALYPDDAETADSLLRKADQAMYEVKANGRNGCQFYTREMQERSEYRHALLNKLIAAVNQDELEAYFQPIFDLKTNKLMKCESLARWKDAEGDFISPDDFITLAEESGLINRIDLFMLQSASSFLAKLSADVGLSINISPRLFHTKDKALDSWLNCIKKASEAVQITVEITERLLTDDSESALNVLQELRGIGVQIAIDDFGIGYSSLSYLVKYPIDIIKIDKSFVQDINISSSAETLIESILAMATRLGIKVVAEGIETQEQLEYLQKHGCDFGQGYYLGRPMNDESFAELLEKNF